MWTNQINSLLFSAGKKKNHGVNYWPRNISEIISDSRLSMPVSLTRVKPVRFLLCDCFTLEIGSPCLWCVCRRFHWKSRESVTEGWNDNRFKPLVLTAFCLTCAVKCVTRSMFSFMFLNTLIKKKKKKKRKKKAWRENQKKYRLRAHMRMALTRLRIVDFRPSIIVDIWWLLVDNPLEWSNHDPPLKDRLATKRPGFKHEKKWKSFASCLFMCFAFKREQRNREVVFFPDRNDKKQSNGGRERELSLIHIWRCRRDVLCRSRWSPYH